MRLAKITARPRIKNLIRHRIVPTADRKVFSRLFNAMTAPMRQRMFTILPAWPKLRPHP